MAKFILSAFADEAGITIDEQIAGLKRNGMRFSEVRSIGEKNILKFTDEELYEIKKALDESGIKVNSLGSPIGKYNIEDDFEPHYKEFIRALEICNILETDKMRMFSFFVKEGEYDKWRDEVIRRLKIMAECAKKYGVTLCHENESKIYGQYPAEVRDILSSVPEIKGIFDAANYRMHNADTIDGINATFVNFAYMHIKDAIFETQEIVPAGEGEGKLDEVIELINKHTDDYVYLTLEPHLRLFGVYKSIDKKELKGRYRFETSAEAFDFAADALKKLLTKLGYIEEDGVWTK